MSAMFEQIRASAKIGDDGLFAPAGGHEFVSIHDKTDIWCVCDGYVDIFLKENRTDSIASARHHLARIHKGEAFFGLNTSLSHVSLVAVGSIDARLFQLPGESLPTFLKDPSLAREMASLVDKWLKSLCQALHRDFMPRGAKIINAGEELHLRKGQSVTTQKGILWLRLDGGSLSFVGQKKMEQRGDAWWLPVSDNTWFEAQEDLSLKAYSTTEYFAEDASLEALVAFEDMLSHFLEDLHDDEVIEERKHLDERMNADREVFSDALDHLSHIIEGETFDGEMASRTGDPLFKAAERLGEYMGIAVQQPANMGRDKSDHHAIEAIARASLFRTRRVLLRGEWWKQDCGPMLGHIDKTKEPVAIIPRLGKGYDLIDASGKRQVVDAEIAETISPGAWYFYRAFPIKALNALDILRFGFRGCWSEFLMIIAVGAIGGILGLITPILTGLLFDNVIPSAQRVQLIHMGIALVLVAFVSGLFQLVRSFATLRIEAKMNTSVQAAMWDRLLGLPLPFFRKFSAGDLAQRAHGIDAIRATLSGVVLSGILSSVFSLTSFFLLFYYDVRLALAATVLAAVAILVSCALAYLHLHYERLIAAQEGRLMGQLLQLLEGIAKIRVAGAEKRAFAQWAKTFSLSQGMSVRLGIWEIHFSTFNIAFPVITSMIIYALVVSGDNPISAGQFLAFNSAFGQFLSAVLGLSGSLLGVLEIIPLFERAKPILETLPEIDEQKLPPGELKGRIELSHINFSYDEDGPTILKDVSIEAHPGEFIALVGSSGSGKSTLLRLMLGFETPTSGSLFFDEKDLSGLDIREVRRQLGVVLQNSQITAGDIYRNICGNANLTIEEAWEAARMAAFDQDIGEMPMGMHTVLSHGGGTLSGGQRQRLLIARSIASKPRILFFDEATSALDNRSQDIVSKSIEGLNATRIVIAHRLSTIKNANRIYVLDQGQVIEAGNYDELMAQEGYFYGLASRQIA